MASPVHELNADELRRRLEEVEETLRAIRSGEVDALVVDGPDGERIYTLHGADHPYRVLIEGMQQGAATLGGDGTVLYCNRRFAEMVGRPHEKVIGASVAGFLRESHRPHFETMLSEGLTRSSQGELEFRAPDDVGLPVSVALSPLPLGGAAALGMIVTDLTEPKKHQDLQDASRRKDEFLAMLAHELRNPLAPIQNGVAILHRLSVSDEKLTYAREVIGRQVHQLSRLVDDLLDVSRITLGKVKLQKEPIELATVIARAIETSRPAIDARGHHLTISFPPRGVWVDADPTRLAQVIGNLLTNAAKYTDEGGQIVLSAEREGDNVLIRVRDTGIGIPATLLPLVFDLFTQGDRSLARSDGGLGIGLTLVRRLVEMHHGTVEAHSDGAGQGSEFVVRLPALAFGERPAENRGGPEADANGATRQRVLIVEDNKDGADSLAMLLSQIGHQVQIAHTGSEALQTAIALRPEVVLLDIGLPGMNGYDLAKQLRGLPDFGSTVLIAMTGYGQEDDKQRSREAGCNHHLVKPVDLQLLTKLLKSLQPPGAPTLAASQ